MRAKKQNLLKLATAVAATWLLAQGTAHAVPSPVTDTAAAMIMTGEVTSYWYDTIDPFGGSVFTGADVSGTYIVDPGNAVDQNTADDTLGVYTWDWSQAPEWGFEVNVGGNIFTADNVTVNIYDRSYDYYVAYGISSDVDKQVNMSLSLFDGTGTAFDDDSFVLEPVLDDFQSSGVTVRSLSLSSNGLWNLNINITSSIQTLVDPYICPGSNIPQDDPCSVPEPTSSLLIGLGLIGIGLARRRYTI